MLILTNGLTEKADEGFLKVANSLVKQLKKANPDLVVASYERQSPLTDVFVDANKFLTNRSIRALCAKHGQVLYIPFPTRKWVMALRVFLLSKCAKKLRVLLVLKTPIGSVGRLLLRKSRAEIIVLSKESADFYGEMLGRERVTYLKTGVDTKRFVPVSSEACRDLKIKYGFDPHKKLVLHVGHLNAGRNVQQLLQIREEYQVLLVTSTLTRDEQDADLKKQLLARPNIRIMEDYIPHIQEIYQMCDVYFFPVVACGNCIDVPLSCLEAMACGKPIVTTPYGEMRQLIGASGVYPIESFDSDTIHEALRIAMEDSAHVEEAVAPYDWSIATSYLL